MNSNEDSTGPNSDPGLVGNRPPTPLSYRALDWLQRRAAGEHVTAIAAGAGVSAETIRRATNPWGPFPRTAKQARIKALRDTWVQLRREGVSTAEIARRHGVSRKTVATTTADDGPYPQPGTLTPDPTTDWVTARRAGISVAAIAAAAAVPTRRVANATRPYGPYPHPPKPPLPDGVVGLSDLARQLGVTSPTVTSWVSRGYLPPPDFTTRRGRRLWLANNIAARLPHSGLRQCHVCDAWTRQLARHQTMHQPETPEYQQTQNADAETGNAS